ncbi:efflux transporter outer membrane subunit [Sphingobium sp. SCG-1]|uniref:efflux transporter outer membrane subunit n=1 Tax=Sphingobium sp. SCG-1 TaxID=2072936 RepID=UPI001670B645|nr:efflux transporter outer membrane subunit [Sphingobium sp. SCG-1]
MRKHWLDASPFSRITRRKSVRYPLAFLTGTALALSGCAVGPNYKPPAAASLGVPATYTAAQGAPLSDAALADWWRGFNDPVLDGLIEQAIANNLDIAQGVARLDQAREALRQAGASYLPNVSASGSGGRNFREGTTGSIVDANGNIIGGSSGGGSSNQYSGSLRASWEIDLFGRIGRTVEATRADLAASGYSLANVRIAIIAETVSNYITARLSQERLRIAREQLATAQDNFNITRWRVEAGLVSSLDQEQARAQLAQQTAAIPQLEAGLANAFNRIAVLTGQAPGEATRALETAAPVPTAPTDIATGIPADTLRQRPDVRQAERTLAAATARIGVEQSALYPQLSLSGNIGTTALSLGRLGDVITGSLFGNLAQLIFDGGATASRVRAQEAAARGAFSAYKSTVLVALEDVENALVADRNARARVTQLTIAVDAANNSAIIARSQYQAGLTDFQTLLTSEQSLLSARDGLASARADQVQAVAQLYSALGGGWQTMNGRPE